MEYAIRNFGLRFWRPVGKFEAVRFHGFLVRPVNGRFAESVAGQSLRLSGVPGYWTAPFLLDTFVVYYYLELDMSKTSVGTSFEDIRFCEEILKDLKYLSPIGVTVAFLTLVVFNFKNVASISDKWLTDIFTDHISFSSIGFAFLLTAISLSAAGSLNSGKFKEFLIGFGFHVTRRLLAYCSASFGFLVGFIVVVTGYGLFEKNQQSFATAALMALFGFFLLALPLLSAVLASTVGLPPSKKKQRTFLVLFALSIFCFLIPFFLSS